MRTLLLEVVIMRFRKMLCAAVAAACIATTSVFAEPINSNSSGDGKAPKQEERVGKEGYKKSEDPIKALKERKEKVKSLVKEGKISKEKADAINAKIDEKIKRIEEFNKLPVEQKREKLISGFQAFVERKVKEGKLTKEEAEELVKEFTDRIQKWNGKGYPDLRKDGCCKHRNKKGNKLYLR
jgi:polyhydroxyalkanoate synthesis regulator phasin